MRKLASVQVISEVKPIEGADSIEAVRVNGWWVVSKKDEFVVGDKVVYFEIDSFIPNKLAPFLTKRGKEPSEFNGVRGERLRTVRLRGQLSQGLVLSTELCGVEDGCVGDEVTESLGVQKWERPLEGSLVGQCLRNFPNFIPKTDQERVQNLPSVFDNLDKVYEITLKLDGSSCTVYFKDGVVGVCSRNLELKINEENANNAFIIATEELREDLPKLNKNYAIQGEVLGPKIQKNRENLSKPTFYCYNVFDIDEQRYLTPSERMGVVDELELLHVPIVHVASLRELTLTNVEQVLEYADKPSMYHKIAEGFVFKPYDYSESFKVINNKYLLKYED